MALHYPSSERSACQDVGEYFHISIGNSDVSLAFEHRRRPGLFGHNHVSGYKRYEKDINLYVVDYSGIQRIYATSRPHDRNVIMMGCRYYTFCSDTDGYTGQRVAPSVLKFGSGALSVKR